MFRGLLLTLFFTGCAWGQEFVTGRKLEEALNKPAGGVWAGVSRRTVVESIADAGKLALLLDRRIDPSEEVSLEASGRPTRTVFLNASPKGAELRVVGDVVYLGPEASASRLRTAIALREDELKASGASKERQHDLLRRKTVRWGDLQSPRQILEQIGAEWSMKIEGLERVPHDLWRSASLPNATAVEALSLVLVQFDLTFSWTAEGVRLAPLPETLAINRLHSPPKGTSAKAAAEKWMQSHPGLLATVEGAKIVVTGTIEQHEALSERRAAPKETTAPILMPPSLSRVRFTLKFDNALRTLLETLNKSPDAQLMFEYDEAVLKQAGIDLDQRVKFEVSNATANQLLKAAFDPAGIDFSIQDRTVKLSARSK